MEVTYKINEQGLHASQIRNMFNIIMFGIVLLKLSNDGKLSNKNIHKIVLLTALSIGFLSTYTTFYLKNDKYKYELWKRFSIFLCILYSYVIYNIL